MSRDDFNERLARVEQSKGQQVKPLTAPTSVSGPSRAVAFLKGVLISAVVFGLFHNIDWISDNLAPEFIKESSAPGAVGGVVAILTIAWMIITPLRFIREIVAVSLGRVEHVNTFPIGAFVAMGAYFFIFHSDRLL